MTVSAQDTQTAQAVVSQATRTWVGIDVSKATLDTCLLTGDTFRHKSFPNSGSRPPPSAALRPTWYAAARLCWR